MDECRPTILIINFKYFWLPRPSPVMAALRILFKDYHYSGLIYMPDQSHQCVFLFYPPFELPALSKGKLFIIILSNKFCRT